MKKINLLDCGYVHLVETDSADQDGEESLILIFKIKAPVKEARKLHEYLLNEEMPKSHYFDTHPYSTRTYITFYANVTLSDLKKNLNKILFEENKNITQQYARSIQELINGTTNGKTPDGRPCVC